MYYNVTNDPATIANIMVDDAICEGLRTVWYEIVRPLMNDYWKAEQWLAKNGRPYLDGFKKTTSKLAEIKQIYDRYDFDFTVKVDGVRIYEVTSGFGCLRCYADDWNTPQF